MRPKHRWPHLAVLFRIYLFLIAGFSAFRLLLFVLESYRLEGPWPWSTILGAFLMGLRFDLVIAGYFFVLPALLLSIAAFVPAMNKLFFRFAFWWTFLTSTIGFIALAADLPYFSHFFARLNIAFFKLGQNLEFGFNMVIEEPRYWFGVIPAILLSLLAWGFYRKTFRTYEGMSFQGSRGMALGMTLLALFLVFTGIRGRVAIKSPIRVGTAYFSDNPFLNQLGLNPVFTLMRSWLDDRNPANKKLHLMEDKLALEMVRRDLGIVPDSLSDQLLARNTHYPDSLQRKPNIIFVIMESMSAGKMGRYGHPGNLTPFLDSLADHSLSFDRCYSAGIHTFNGVYGSIFSFPSLYLQHPMRGVQIPRYNGMATALKKHGYHTSYFTTHDGQFDNVEGFLRGNDFDEVYAQDDYPSEKILSTLGVTDDYLFEFALPILDKYADKGSPFLSVFMTASDHGPYIIPDYYSPRDTKAPVTDQIVDYADWSLQKFYLALSKRAWARNSVLVFIADHGGALHARYEMPLNYHHVPLIIHDLSGQLPDSAITSPAGQIDAFPTLMGALSLNFRNTTPGMDLLHEQRPCMYFCADDKIGVIDGEHYLIIPKEGPEKLYAWTTGSRDNLLDQEPEKARAMREYAFSHMQAAQMAVTELNSKLP